MVFIPYYIFILAGTIVIDYWAGIIIENSKTEKRKKQFLIVSILSNLSVLMVFKYFDFFITSINQFLSLFGITHPTLHNLGILLPIGLSFHTFQAISYIIEVYRGKQKAERNFVFYSLYIMFFPQLVAGPIERPYNILPQFHKKYKVNYIRIVAGLKQMLWGFFKKLVIADGLAILVKQGFDNINNHDGISLLIYSYCFAFQIYCDFSGYSDIAIGTAKVLGINLMENFRTPYFSKSINEFWQRWHISLSSWFRDYLYIPLGGNRTRKWRWYYNVIVVFLISGFWHGANWTFIIWGAVHGLYVLVGAMLNKKHTHSLNSKRNNSFFYSILKIFFTFNLVSFAWIFFRAKSVTDAFLIIKRIFSSTSLTSINHLTLLKSNTMASVFVTLGLLILFIFTDRFMDNLVKQRAEIKSKILNYMVYAGVLAFTLLFGHFTETSFIYFQF